MIGGTHIVSGSGSQLTTEKFTLKLLVLRLQAGASVTSLRLDGVKVGELKADEQLVLGPFALAVGGIRPNDFNVIGTADDELYWFGVEA